MRGALVGNGHRRAYKAVVLDVDGTLVTGAGAVSERNRTALAAVQQLGVRVVLATGRHPRAIRRLCHHLGLKGFHICVNGALVVDPLSGEVALARCLNVPEVDEVLTFFRKHSFGGALYRSDVILTDREDLLASFAAFEERQVFYVPEISSPDPGVLKIIGFPPPEVPFREAFQLVRDAFGTRFSVTSGDSACVEVAHCEATKGTALLRWCRTHGIAPSEVIAVGDSYNDLELLQVAGTGVAVANAVPELRKAARLVVGSCEEDGVAEALRLLFGWPGTGCLGGEGVVER
ncbi:MAG: Cof-type HAD-IIB family hydrolase [Bacillota bacterium]